MSTMARLTNLRSFAAEIGVCNGAVAQKIVGTVCPWAKVAQKKVRAARMRRPDRYAVDVDYLKRRLPWSLGPAADALASALAWPLRRML